MEKSISRWRLQSLASPRRCGLCFRSGSTGLRELREPELPRRQRHRRRHRAGTGHTLHRSYASARHANRRERCDRVRGAPVADVDDHAAVIWLFLLLAHAAICDSNATSARSKKLCHSSVGLAGSRVARGWLDLPARRAALRQHIFCHAAALYWTIERAFALPARERPRAFGQRLSL